MIDNMKVINFLQDFGCAKLEHLQVLFNDKNNNFKQILSSNMISKKGNIFVHNTKKIDEKMLFALDVLCKYKGRYKQFYRGYEPIYISFLTDNNILYHIIVSDFEDSRGVVKLINSYPLSLPNADKLILLFPNKDELENINCKMPYLYCIYPNIEIINL